MRRFLFFSALFSFFLHVSSRFRSHTLLLSSSPRRPRPSAARDPASIHHLCPSTSTSLPSSTGLASKTLVLVLLPAAVPVLATSHSTNTMTSGEILLLPWDLTLPALSQDTLLGLAGVAAFSVVAHGIYKWTRSTRSIPFHVAVPEGKNMIRFILPLRTTALTIFFFLTTLLVLCLSFDPCRGPARLERWQHSHEP